MAGTLTVQNIQGPSSGSDANTILIPSGQALHAPGHVIQVAEPSIPWASRWSTTSSTASQTPHSVSITPKFSDSNVQIHCTFNGGFGNSTLDYMRLYLKRNVGGTRTNLAETGSGNNIMTTGGTSSTLWFTGSFHFIDAPNTTSSVTYELWAGLYYGSGNTGYMGWSSTFDGTNGVYMTATEIAQ